MITAPPAIRRTLWSKGLGVPMQTAGVPPRLTRGSGPAASIDLFLPPQRGGGGGELPSSNDLPIDSTV